MFLLPAVASGTPTLNTIHHCDALTLLKALPAASIDAVITDMPYGTTDCAWDIEIDTVAWWYQIARVLKRRGVVVTTASQPFTSRLVMSNPKWFKYSWIWQKNNPSNPQLAKYQPLKVHEDILIFSAGSGAYYPQGLERYHKNRKKDSGSMAAQHRKAYTQDTTNYPKSIQRFNFQRGMHPTQKPVALYEYLIQTYTRPGELVLDPFSGSGTTAIAARKTGRNFVCCDSSLEYVEMSRKRLRDTDPYQSREVAPGLIQKSMFAGMSV